MVTESFHLLLVETSPSLDVPPLALTPLAPEIRPCPICWLVLPPGATILSPRYDYRGRDYACDDRKDSCRDIHASHDTCRNIQRHNYDIQRRKACCYADDEAHHCIG